MLIENIDLNRNDLKPSHYKSRLHIKDRIRSNILSNDSDKGTFVEQIITDLLCVSLDRDVFPNENNSEKRHKKYFMIDDGFCRAVLFDNVMDIIKFIYNGEFSLLNHIDDFDGELSPINAYYINIIQPMLAKDCNLLDASLGVKLRCGYEDFEWPYVGYSPEYSTIYTPDGVVYLNSSSIYVGHVVLEKINKEEES